MEKTNGKNRGTSRRITRKERKYGVKKYSCPTKVHVPSPDEVDEEGLW